MATQLAATKCCGMGEIDNLSHSRLPQDALRDIAIPLYARRHVFAVFSGVTRRRVPDHASGRSDDYGQAFRDFILDSGLGSVTETDARHNLNSGNYIRVWMWTVDLDALKTWMLKNGFTWNEENGWQQPTQ